MSSEKKMETGSKVTLSSGKVVLLREPKIMHQTLAAQRVGSKANGDQLVFAVMLNKELISLLIHSVDGKAVSPQEAMDLDSLFSVKDYSELNKVVSELTGGESPLELKVETTTFGSK